jgi:NADPH2:quinone reductase
MFTMLYRNLKVPVKAIYLTRHFKNLEEINLDVVDRPKPKIKPGECLIQVHSSGINQSDAKGTLGFFSHAKLPRIPGRDFAGVVVEGKFAGKKVWGTGGAAGIDFDGTHAEYLVLPESAIAEIPHNLTVLQAGSQTLPYTTAYYGLVSRARIQPGERVLVIGALGQVGRAAMSICKWKKCRAVALVREKSLEKARAMGWEATAAIDADFDVIFNPLGTVYWDDALKRMKKFGRMIVIGAGPDPKGSGLLPLLPLYRANQEILGINSVDLDFTANAKLLNEMKPGFDSGQLIPLSGEVVFPLERATEAYKTVLNQSDQRVVLNLVSQ